MLIVLVRCSLAHSDPSEASFPSHVCAWRILTRGITGCRYRKKDIFSKYFKRKDNRRSFFRRRSSSARRTLANGKTLIMEIYSTGALMSNSTNVCLKDESL